MIFDRLFAPPERRSLTNPSATLLSAFSGGIGPTVSGETVNEQTALTLPAYYAAIRAISEDAAKLPLILYRRNGENKERATKHWLYPLLHDQPSPECTSMAFRETLMQHALGWGNGYAEIVRRPLSAQVDALYLLDPTQVRVERANGETGPIVYVVRANTGGERTLQADDVFHLHGLGFNGATGYSAVALARQSIGAGLAEKTSGAALFGNSSRPDGIISHPLSLTDGGVKMKKSWREAFRGASKAHGLAVLEEGATFQPIAVQNKDSQWIEARKFTVLEMARILRIPPHMLFDLERATFSNIEHQALEYVTNTLMPWFVRIEQEVKRKLIPYTEPNLYVEHLADALLRGDTKTRYEAHAIARTHGWLSANDVLRMENRNGIGEQGDIYMVQANMVNAERMLDEPEPASEPVEPDLEAVARAHLGLLEAVYARILKLEADKVARASKRDDFAEWLALFYRNHQGYVSEALWPVVDAVCHTMAEVCGDKPYEQRRANRLAIEMAERHIQQSLDNDLADKHDRTTALAVWTNGRAAKAAEDELPRLMEVTNGT